MLANAGAKTAKVTGGYKPQRSPSASSINFIRHSRTESAQGNKSHRLGPKVQVEFSEAPPPQISILDWEGTAENIEFKVTIRND